MNIQKPNPRYMHSQNEPEANSRAAAAKLKGQSELDGALDTAIRFRDVLQAKALLAAGANPNTIDINNASILGHAIMSKKIESVELLLAYHANPNLRTGLGTPLTLTIFEEQWDMMKRLLAAGADVNAIGSIRSTALHIVVEYARDPKLVKMLLQHGANVNAKDAKGETPLDRAERIKNKAIIRLLKKAGAKSGTKEKHLRASAISKAHKGSKK